MSSHARKKNQIKHLSHSIQASEMVSRSLQDLGFELGDSEVLFRDSSPRLKVDFVMRRGRKAYAVEVKSSRQMHLAFMHLLPRAILRLQAVNRIGSLLPVVAIVVDRLESRDIQRMAEYMNLYAPDVGWLLLDMQRRGVFRDQEKDQYALVNEGQVEWVKSLLSVDSRFSRVPAGPVSVESSVSSSSSSISSSSSSILPSSSSSDVSLSRIQLSFSDLDQWLIKVFLMSPLDVASQYWGGPKGYAENAFQLSKLAGVSQMPANLWAQAMESSGYLKRIGRKDMIPLRLKALLEEWVGRYRFGDNRSFPHRLMYPVSDYDAFFEEILGNIKQYNKELAPLAIAAHQACKLYEIKHSAARSIHIYCWGDIQEVARSLNLVPSDEEHNVDIFLVEPKYPKSVFGGMLQKKGIPVCDILQCYLDVFHLPDRGREQADLIYENIISKIISMRQGH